MYVPWPKLISRMQAPAVTHMDALSYPLKVLWTVESVEPELQGQEQKIAISVALIAAPSHVLTTIADSLVHHTSYQFVRSPFINLLKRLATDHIITEHRQFCFLPWRQKERRKQEVNERPLAQM
jgi:hypothetical protein